MNMPSSCPEGQACFSACSMECWSVGLRTLTSDNRITFGEVPFLWRGWGGEHYGCLGGRSELGLYRPGADALSSGKP